MGTLCADMEAWWGKMRVFQRRKAVVSLGSMMRGRIVSMKVK